MATIHVRRLKFILLLALALVIIFDIGGWGRFILDLATSFIIHLVIALVLFILLYSAIRFLRRLFNVSFSSWQKMQPLIFPIAAVLTLPLLGSIRHRPVDTYDVIQTVALIVGFHYVAEPVQRFVRKIKLTYPNLLATSTSRTSVGSARPRPTSPLYRNLLVKVNGNRGTAERLIEYERGRAPYADDEELIRNAIERWERDNR